jgi:hypothetical protein
LGNLASSFNEMTRDLEILREKEKRNAVLESDIALACKRLKWDCFTAWIFDITGGQPLEQYLIHTPPRSRPRRGSKKSQKAFGHRLCHVARTKYSDFHK